MEELNVYWMRHSITTANTASKKERIWKKFPDTNIHTTVFSFYDNVKEDTSYHNDTVKPINYVFCSSLKRALQTAMVFYWGHFKEGKLKRLPGISEEPKGMTGWEGKENSFYDCQTLIDKIRKWLIWLNLERKHGNMSSINHPLFKMLDEDNGIDKVMDLVKKVCMTNEEETQMWSHIEEQKKPVDVSLFMPTLFKYVNYLKQKGQMQNTENNVVIVSHSHFIKARVYPNSGLDKFIDIENKPPNNKVIPLTYTNKEGRVNTQPLSGYDYKKYQGCKETEDKTNFLCDFDEDDTFEVGGKLTERLKEYETRTEVLSKKAGGGRKKRSKRKKTTFKKTLLKKKSAKNKKGKNKKKHSRR